MKIIAEHSTGYAQRDLYADVPSTAAQLTQQADHMLAGLFPQSDLTSVSLSEGPISEGNTFHSEGLNNVLTPYGDYFYVEALMRAWPH